MIQAIMRAALLTIALLLPGCSHPARDIALYDIAPAPTAQSLPFPILLEPFDSAPPYTRKELLYRLDYAGGQLRPYANSAWRTPPDILLAAALQQAGGGNLRTLDSSPQRARCALRVGLAHFEQVFSDEKNSRAEVEVHFTLVQLRNHRELKRDGLRLQVAAATSDARGGAQALQEAGQQAAGRIVTWLNESLAAPGTVRAACAP